MNEEEKLNKLLADNCFGSYFDRNVGYDGWTIGGRRLSDLTLQYRSVFDENHFLRYQANSDRLVLRVSIVSAWQFTECRRYGYVLEEFSCFRTNRFRYETKRNKETSKKIHSNLGKYKIMFIFNLLEFNRVFAFVFESTIQLAF